MTLLFWLVVTSIAYGTAERRWGWRWAPRLVDRRAPLVLEAVRRTDTEARAEGWVIVALSWERGVARALWERAGSDPFQVFFDYSQ